MAGDIRCEGMRIAFGLSIEIQTCADSQGNKFKRYGVGIGPQVGVLFGRSHMYSRSPHAIDTDGFLGIAAGFHTGSDGHMNGSGTGLGAGVSLKYSYTHPLQALKPSGG